MIYSCGSEGDCWLEFVGSGPTLGLGACCIPLLTGIGARGATIGLNAGLPIMFGGPPKPLGPMPGPIIPMGPNPPNPIPIGPMGPPGPPKPLGPLGFLVPNPSCLRPSSFLFMGLGLRLPGVGGGSEA